MAYKYTVHTMGTSGMFNLEEMGMRLEECLNQEEAASYAEQSWEMW